MGSNPIESTIYGSVGELAKPPRSHRGEYGFEPRRSYHRGGVEGAGILRLSFKQDLAGSIPVAATTYVQ